MSASDHCCMTAWYVMMSVLSEGRKECFVEKLSNPFYLSLSISYWQEQLY